MSALQMNLSSSPRAQKFEAFRNKEVYQFIFPFFASFETLQFISVNAVIWKHVCIAVSEW